MDIKTQVTTVAAGVALAAGLVVSGVLADDVAVVSGGGTNVTAVSALAAPLSGEPGLPRFSTVAADPTDTLVVLGVTSPGTGYDVVSADLSEEGASPSDDWSLVGSGAASSEEAFFYDAMPDPGVSRLYFVTASGPQSESGRADGQGPMSSGGESRRELARSLPPGQAEPGLFAEFWRTPCDLVEPSGFEGFMPSATAVVSVVDFPDSPWPAGGPAPGDRFACRLAGMVDVPADGTYEFFLTSDDGVRLRLDGALVLSDPSPHQERTRSESVALTAGWKTVEILYYENAGSEALKLEWSGPGLAREVVPAEAFCHMPPEDRSFGFIPGLEVEYYAFQSALSSMPDFTAFSPVASGVVDRIAFPRSAGAFDGAPASLTNRFAAVFRGLVWVEKAGFYDLRLTSDDGSVLYVDGAAVVDHDGLHGMLESKTGSVPLSRGFHALRLEYFENIGDAGLELAWALPGCPFDVVPARFLFHAEGGVVSDSDSDGMPDWWETLHGLDPLDPSDAALDPDGDGITNLAEFLAGTDPRSADTDSDGMPDAWELAHGLCPFADDSLADADGDGLRNLEEFASGADPNLSDSDGDGILDGDERHLYFSDPSSVDFFPQVETNMVVAAVSADEAYGDWAVEDDTVFLLGRSGTLFYTNDLDVADAGVRQLRAEVSFVGPCFADLVCRVDGELAGVFRLPASDVAAASEAVFLTQWLAPGRHEVSLELQNFMNGASFAMRGVAVCRPCGPDADGNGRPDWMDARIRNSSVDRSGLVLSKVSPYCMRGAHASSLVPEVSTPSGALPVRRLPLHGWCSDVSLSATQDVSVAVVYENGMKSENVTVRWSEFDVTAEGDVVVRKGDSLRLSLGGASGTISVDGVVVSRYGGTVAYRFNSCGKHVVVGTCGGEVHELKVDVVSCAMPDGVPLWLGKTTSLRFSGNGLDHMSAATDLGTSLVAASVATNDCVLSIASSVSSRPAALSFEIPNPDASVVASAATSPFDVHYTLDGEYYSRETLDDGTSVIENRISAFGLPGFVQLRMTGNSGICFEDGSGTLELDATDFDETGDCFYRFLAPPDVTNPCQFLHVFFNYREVAQ